MKTEQATVSPGVAGQDVPRPGLSPDAATTSTMDVYTNTEQEVVEQGRDERAKPPSKDRPANHDVTDDWERRNLGRGR